MEKVRTVIWDCDNLMWIHKKEEPYILAGTLGIRSQHIDEFSEEFYNMFKKFMEYFSNRLVTKKETLKIIEKEMPILGLYNISAVYFISKHNEQSLKVNVFNSDTLKVLEYLKNKNIKSIVKTDWWRITQEELLYEFGVLDYIEELHCCDDAYLKANPQSAKEIIKPGREEEYLIIGDSLTSDIAFAQHAGIKSIWVNRLGEENHTQFQPTYEIASLLDAIQII